MKTTKISSNFFFNQEFLLQLRWCHSQHQAFCLVGRWQIRNARKTDTRKDKKERGNDRHTYREREKDGGKMRASGETTDRRMTKKSVMSGGRLLSWAWDING